MPAQGAYSGPTQSSFGQSPMEVQQGQNQNSWLQSVLAQQLGTQQGGYALKQQKLANQGQLAQAQTAAEASKYGANTQLQGLQAQLAQSQGRYNQIFPMIAGAYGQISGAAGGGMNNGSGYGIAGGQGGGAVGNYGYGTAQAPPVAAPPSGGGLAPAISQGQINANVNLNNAQNWSQAGGESRRQTQQLAGSGLGATSPLARALQAQTFGGALAANTAGATTAREGAAELNAKQALGGYQADKSAQASEYGSQVAAQASQYNARLNYQAALAQVQAQRQNSLLAALSNFAGSV